MIHRFSGKFTAVMMAAAMVLSSFAMTPVTACAGEDGFIDGIWTITRSGTYHVDENETGTIKIDSGLEVTLTGSGVENSPNQELLISCGRGVELTLEDMYIKNDTDMNFIDFQGDGNVLMFSGTNLLEGESYAESAMIHAGADTELTFRDGGGCLYLYKRTQGSGIGSNAEEANGVITFESGSYFLKGTKTGAVIGNDTCGDASMEQDIGNIYIKGGNLCIEANAKGSAIGGSNQSNGGQVFMSGGTVTIYNDFSGSSIGNGASAADGGTFAMTGGSLKCVMTANGAAAQGTRAGVNDISLRADKVNADGENVYVYSLDVSEYEADEDGCFSVTVDNEAYFNGKLHAYEYTPDTMSTMNNWTKTDSDSCVYLYLTEGEHSVSVNGGEEFRIDVQETVYPEEEPEIPGGCWSDHADTSWYDSTSSSFSIYTEEELAGLAAIVDAGTDTFKGKTVYLRSDLDLSAYEWEPAGDADHVFMGTFDGGENDIAGVYYYDYVNDEDYQGDWYAGLFARAENATFRNISIAGGYVCASAYVGAVLGCGSGDLFENCENSAEVCGLYKTHNGTHTYGRATGGIVGEDQNAVITGCINNGTVKGAFFTAGISGSSFVAGSGSAGTGTVEDCINYGKISSNWDGGCAGITTNASQVLRCANYGEINSEINTAAGIANADCRVVDSCFNAGTVSGSSAGGIFCAPGADNVTVINCYNTGTVSNRFGHSYSGGAGGIVGEIRLDTTGFVIKNCYNTGVITETDSCGSARNGSVIGGVYQMFYSVRTFNRMELLSYADYQYYAAGDQGERLVFYTLDNNYYLEGVSSGGVGSEDIDGGTKCVEPSEMKSLAETLGDAFSKDENGINNGYPVLKWQNGSLTPNGYSFMIDADKEGCSITVTDGEGNELAADENGTYEAEAGAICRYHVWKEGYVPVNGVVTEADDDREIKAAMEPVDVDHTLAFDCNIGGAAFNVGAYSYNYAEQDYHKQYDVPMNADGTFDMHAGLYYRYEVTLGEETFSGQLLAAHEDETVDIDFTAESTSVRFDPDREGTVITVTDEAGTDVLPQKDGSYSLLKGTEYDYTAVLSGYPDVTGSLKTEGDSMTVEISFHHALGDINLDDAVDAADLQLMRSYLAGDTELSGESFDTADTNKDGLVNNKDLLRLRTMLAESAVSAEEAEEGAGVLSSMDADGETVLDGGTYTESFDIADGTEITGTIILDGGTSADPITVTLHGEVTVNVADGSEAFRLATGAKVLIKGEDGAVIRFGNDNDSLRYLVSGYTSSGKKKELTLRNLKIDAAGFPDDDYAGIQGSCTLIYGTWSTDVTLDHTEICGLSRTVSWAVYGMNVYLKDSIIKTEGNVIADYSGKAVISANYVYIYSGNIQADEAEDNDVVYSDWGCTYLQPEGDLELKGKSTCACIQVTQQEDHPITYLAVDGVEYDLDSVTWPLNITSGFSDSLVIKTSEKCEISADTSSIGAVYAGEEFSVPVVIRNNHGFWAAGLDYGYDTDAFELESVTIPDGSIINGKALLSGNGKIQLEAEELEDTRDDGVLVYLNFEVRKDAAEGSYDISVSPDDNLVINDKEEELTPNFSSGSITVEKYEYEGLLGDVNFNDKINIVDAQITYNIANGKYKDEEKYETMCLAADVNGDGVADVLDARAIQYYVHTGAFQ